MKTSTRRDFLNAAATAISGVVAGGAAPPSLATAAPYDADAMAAEISAKLFADDGLTRPIPETPTVSDLAKGLDRTLVLGGGGEYYVAWYCGFFHGLYELGVDLNIAEMVVGTSAGSYAGSSLTSGHFQRLRLEFDFFGHFPSLFARLAPVASPNLSQKRAQEINFSVKDGSPASIRAIGRAALAADNRVKGSAVERLASLLTGDSTTGWPVAKMYTTANDCYTGERLIVGQEVARRNSIPLAHAAAASSSLPGVIGLTLLGQRFCMDGGISRTWAHTDVVAGSKRALVITLTNGYEGSLLSGIPHNIYKEIDALPSDRYADDVDHRWHAHWGEPARSRPNRASIKDGTRARQGRGGQDPEILGLTLSAESAAPSGKLSVQLYSNAPSPRSLLEGIADRNERVALGQVGRV